MKKITIFLILCIIFLSCSKKDTAVDGPNGGGNPTNTATSIIFENNTFTGSCIVTYSDGVTFNGMFTSGKMDIPSTGANKVIASIQPQNQQIIFIGRKEPVSLKLNYNGSTLSHRTAVNGYVPIGTFAEFQLINLNSTTLSASYKQEDNLYFLNNVWKPIGSDFNNPFTGNFDGNNKEINQLNVSVTGSSTFAGLFGYTVNSQFSNIIIASGTVKGQSTSAGIAAYCSSINNCKNYANIEGLQAAGVASYVQGTNIEVADCHNYGTIKASETSDYGQGAGVILSGQVTLKNCTNNNIVRGFSANGIAGGLKKIELSTNNGQITSTGFSSASTATGIVGSADIVINCTNNGIVSSYTNAFGISERSSSNGISNIENCKNTANINSNGASGGIGGFSFNTIKNCTNSGNINATGTSNTQAFGIAFTGNISNCSNTGNITATSNGSTGGASSSGISYQSIGFGNSTLITDCYNTGNIQSNTNNQSSGSVCGGIISFASGSLTVNRCFNSGTIQGVYAGGIFGYNSSSSVQLPLNINACYNSGTITTTSNNTALTAGGIGGYNSAAGSGYKIENCFNIGNSNGGGFIGVSVQNSSTPTYLLKNCFWKQGTAPFAILKIYGLSGQITSSNVGATIFSSSAWPSASIGWISTDWKSLGSWNNGSPIYPKLIFEN